MIEIFSALLTPIIAVLGVYIAYQQWRTNNLKLKHELFDRRYECYEKIYEFIANILITGSVPHNADLEFLRNTKAVTFLFDDQIKEFVDSVYRKSVELHSLHSSMSDLNSRLREENLQKQREIKEWLQKEMRLMKKRFAKYLTLKH